MSILSFVSTLTSVLQKDDIKEDIRITRKELTEKLIPLYSGANDYFKNRKFNSPLVVSMNNTFMDIADRGGKYKNIINFINDNLSNVVSNLDQLATYAVSELETTSISDSLSLRKAVFIKGLDLTSFSSIYMFKLLAFIYENENNSDDSILPPPVVKAIIDNVGNFARIFKVMSTNPADFIKDISKVKDLPINKKTLDASSALEDSDDIISGISLTPQFRGNPIYKFRLMIAEWQANRYKINKETKDYLELKLMNLKLANQDKHDPKIDHQINYLAERIKTLEYKMAKQEKSVGGLE